MNKFRFTLNAVAVLVFAMAFASAAQAQATRTWVSGVGDDVNPCSRTAPCKTYAGAISKTAKDGEISTLDPGGFGTITITKSITINGTVGQGYGSILSALAPQGVLVNITDVNDVRKSVRLNNLEVNGASTGTDGIRYLAGTVLHIENCVIDGVTAQGIDASGLTGNGRLIVNNTRVRNIGLEGINLQTTTGQVIAMVTNSTFTQCQTGIRAGDKSRVGISYSIFSHNTNGLVVTAPTGDAQANVDGCFFTYGTNGIQAGTGAVTIRVSRSVIAQNSVGIFLNGGTATSNGNNTVYGNTGSEVFTGAIVPQK
jgi:hypothetical protein